MIYSEIEPYCDTEIEIVGIEKGMLTAVKSVVRVARYAQREVHRRSATRPIYKVHKKQKKSNGNKNIHFDSATHWFL